MQQSNNVPAQVNITLPDGNVMTFDTPVTGTDVATTISKSLGKKAIAMKVNGELKDVYLPINEDAELTLITKQDEEEALDLIRHDCAHIMAQAVQELFPGTQVTIGPNVENGFYYDFHREEPFHLDDLAKIEARMTQIVRENTPIRREVLDRDEAIKLFEGMGEKFKAEIIRDLPENEEVSLYRQGDFVDLCRGPHMPSTAQLGDGFKLMKLAGAYWRGDSNNPQLQRIYGTAWRDKKELKAYLKQLEEAEKRDHRKLGTTMELFHLQEVAQGGIFWHPSGWRVYRKLQDYVRQKMEIDGYVEVNTPSLVDMSLWEASGHAEKFGDDMFTSEVENKTLAIKPMNCPCHVQIFNVGLKSYRDLPLRMAEFGSCHRNEPSGALHGLMRLRAFTQDDAHIFCTEDQITEETIKFCELLKDIYKDFGFDDIRVKFSDRPDVRAGEDAIWDKAETALKDASNQAGLDWTLNPGEGAFYGPKLEFVLRDAIGRDWQCGTLQVDFVLPERLDANYIGADSNKHRPVMLHRAALGSLERFLGILIENTAGHLPLWLSPVPVVVAPITDAASDYAVEVQEMLVANGVHAEVDLRNEKIGYKVREHSNRKIPQIWVVGEREAADRQVAIRQLGSKDNNVTELDKAVEAIVEATKAPV